MPPDRTEDGLRLRLSRTGVDASRDVGVSSAMASMIPGRIDSTEPAVLFANGDRETATFVIWSCMAVTLSCTWATSCSHCGMLSWRNANDFSTSDIADGRGPRVGVGTMRTERRPASGRQQHGRGSRAKARAKGRRRWRQRQRHRQRSEERGAETGGPVTLADRHGWRAGEQCVCVGGAIKAAWLPTCKRWARCTNSRRIAARGASRPPASTAPWVQHRFRGGGSRQTGLPWR